MTALFRFDDYPAATDLLGFTEPAHHLANQIRESSLPLVIGLFGRWGAGKSSYLRLLSSVLTSESTYDGRAFFPVLFEPWKLQDGATAVHDLCTALHLHASDAKASTEVSDRIATNLFLELGNMNFGSFTDFASGAVADFVESQAGLGRAVRMITHRIVGRSPDEVARARIDAATRLPALFKEYVGALCKTPLVIIDDLDRCAPEMVIRVLEGLKLYLGEAEARIVYVLAMDYDIIATIIASHYGFGDVYDGHQFMGKICNLRYFVPRPHIGPLIEAICTQLSRPDDGLDEYWQALVDPATEKHLYNTGLYLPRTLKRVLRELSTMLSPQGHDIGAMLNSLVSAQFQSDDGQYPAPRKACYRLLLSVFALREKYPDIYSQLIYGAHGRRASMLLALAAVDSDSTDRDMLVAVTSVLKEHDMSGISAQRFRYSTLDFLRTTFAAAWLGDGEQNLFSKERIVERVFDPLLDALMGR